MPEGLEEFLPFGRGGLEFLFFDHPCSLSQPVYMQIRKRLVNLDEKFA
jgi:hypothetical protein